MNKKPDALLILAIVFGLGVLASAITHGGGDKHPGQANVAVNAGIDTLPARQ